MQTIIEFQNIQKEVLVDSKKKIKILDNVSFKVKKGRTTGFIGLNGAGKTTSFKALFQFIRPTGGQILYSGHPDLSSDFKRRLGYMPERPFFYEFLTAQEFLKLHWQLLGNDARLFENRMSQLLTLVNLEKSVHQRLKTFSKGMLQRIGIAQALLNDPEFLILDEPMSGLDPLGRSLVKKVMNQHQKKGGTLFFSSHLLQDMEELCQDAIVIHKGRILFQGEVEDFLLPGLTLEESFLKKIESPLPEGSHP